MKRRLWETEQAGRTARFFLHFRNGLVRQASQAVFKFALPQESLLFGEKQTNNRRIGINENTLRLDASNQQRGTRQ